jgi:hypothetical protein
MDLPGGTERPHRATRVKMSHEDRPGRVQKLDAPRRLRVQGSAAPRAKPPRWVGSEIDSMRLRRPWLVHAAQTSHVSSCAGTISISSAAAHSVALELSITRLAPLGTVAINRQADSPGRLSPHAVARTHRRGPGIPGGHRRRCLKESRLDSERPGRRCWCFASIERRRCYEAISCLTRCRLRPDDGLGWLGVCQPGQSLP